MRTTFFDYAGAVVLLVAVTATALRLARARGSSRHEAAIGVAIPFVVIWSSLFFGSFLLLGVAELGGAGGHVAPLPAAAVAIVLCAASLAATRGRARAATGAEARAATGAEARAGDGGALSVPVRLLALATAAMFAVIGATWLIRYPTSYEGQSYVLPYGVWIFANESLGLMSRVFTFTFPADYSIYFGFLAKLLPDHMGTLANLPVIGLFMLAIYGAGRAAGATRDAAGLIALGASTVPIIGFFAFQPFPDLAGVVFVACALTLVLARPAGTVPWALLAGLSAGLAYGMKQTHLVSAALVGLVLIGGSLQGRTARDGLAAAWRPAAAFALGFVLLAGFWLVRNWVLLDNPFYPVSIPVLHGLFGWASAPDFDLDQRSWTQIEWVRSDLEWLVYPWVEWHKFGQNFKTSSGLGAFFATLVPALLIGGIAAVAAARRGASRIEGALAAAMLFLGGVVVIALWYALGDRQPRYVAGSFAFLLPVAAWLLSRLRGRELAVSRTALTLGALFMVFVIASQELVAFASTVFAPWGSGRAGYYQYPPKVDDLPPGSVVINLEERPSNYALLGASLTNRVVPLLEALDVMATTSDDPDHPTLDLCTDAARRLRATHVYASSRYRILDCPSARLREMVRIERNPRNQVPLDYARILYRIERP